MSVIGRIHSFESCGTVDGPGIRFITFFQGCLMRCLYCHNRDTWDTHGGKEITVEELMKEVVTYRHFMNASGGGVTASGGEAILQAEFVRDWFRACKKEGIHTCLDTNGFVRRYDPVIDELLEVTDLVMLDLKQMNDEIHQNHFDMRASEQLARHAYHDARNPAADNEGANGEQHIDAPGHGVSTYPVEVRKVFQHAAEVLVGFFQWEKCALDALAGGGRSRFVFKCSLLFRAFCIRPRRWRAQACGRRASNGTCRAPYPAARKPLNSRSLSSFCRSDP